LPLRSVGGTPAWSGPTRHPPKALSIAIAEDYAAQLVWRSHAAIAEVVETEEGDMDNPIHAAQPNRATIAGMTPRVLRKLAIATVLLVVGLYFIPIITIIWLAAGLIDVLRSSRHVRVELDGRLLAESTRPMLLFETLLPVRFYLPRDDVQVRLEPSDTATYCAYKGRASYYSVPDGPRDVAWTYHDPLHDAEPVRDRICFFDERVDVIVDGVHRERPITPWVDE